MIPVGAHGEGRGRLNIFRYKYFKSNAFMVNTVLGLTHLGFRVIQPEGRWSLTLILLAAFFVFPAVAYFLAGKYGEAADSKGEPSPKRTPEILAAWTIPFLYAVLLAAKAVMGSPLPWAGSPEIPASIALFCLSIAIFYGLERDDIIDFITGNRLIHFVLLAFFLYLLTLSILIGIHHQLGPDAGYYVMYGRAILEGQVPIRDFASMYPPGIYYLQALYLSLHGGGRDALTLQIFTHHALTALFLAYLCFKLKLTRGLGAAFPAILYVFLIAFYEGYGLIIEPISSTWGWAGLSIALATSMPRGESISNEAGRKRENTRTALRMFLYFLAGTLVGLAFMVKQVGAIFIVLAAIISSFDPRTRRLYTILAVLAGALFWWLVFFAAHPDTLPIYFEQNVIGLFNYATVQHQPMSRLLPARLENLWFNRWIAGLLFVAFFIAVFHSRKNRKYEPDTARRHKILLLLSGGGLIMLAPMIFRSYAHYYLYPLPFAITSLFYLLKHYRILRRGFSRAVFFGLLLALFWNLPGRWPNLQRQVEAKYLNERHTAEWIKANAGQSEKAVIVPGVPQYYVLAGLKAPITFYSWLSISENEKLVKAAADEALPVFLVDRGLPYFGEYKELLIRYGFSAVARFGDNTTKWIRKDGN